MNMISESDWKIFRRLSAIALDRHCVNSLRMVRDVTDDATITNHQRYQKLFGLLHDRDKEVAQAFDNPRRSVAFEQLCIICSWGLLTDAELSEFSEGIRERIKFLLGR